MGLKNANLNRLHKAVKDFQSDDNAEERYRWLPDKTHPPEKRVQVDESLVPLPYMVFLIFVSLLQYKAWWRPFEKIAWQIPILFKGAPFLFAHQKFGFAVSSVQDDPDPVIVRDMMKQLRKIAEIADGVFQPFGEDQLRQGNVTIDNKFNELSNRYFFFREKAKKAFASKPPPPKRVKTGRYTMTSSDPFRPEREGSYYMTAAIESFFSKLEHTLTLLLPFHNCEPSQDDLTLWITARWSEKYKRIIDLTQGNEAKRIYDKLVRIRVKFRNPLAHGLLDRDKSGVGFHVEGLGTIPIQLSKFENTLHYNLFPFQQESFSELCSFFDEVDECFQERSNQIRNPFS